MLAFVTINFNPENPLCMMEIVRANLNESSNPTYEDVNFNDNGYSSMIVNISHSDNQRIDEYTFESFVVVDSNKFAHAAARAVVDGVQKKIYNPLFIYGEADLGKTHLLYAIHKAVLTKFPDYRVVYTRASNLAYNLILAIQQDKSNDYIDKLKNADLLLLDDVQFIAGKKNIQQELYGIFDALYERDKQIVITSDKPPCDIPQLEDRVKTQMESGVIAFIQSPDASTCSDNHE